MRIRLPDVWTVLLLLLIAKAILLFAVLPALQAVDPSAYRANHFPDGYDSLAMNLLTGNGYRLFPDTAETMIRTPGFVLWLAAIFAISGKSLTAVQFVHLILSLFSAYLLFRLTKRVTGDRPMALIAVLLFSLHPGTIIAESRGGVESLYTFLIVLFLFFLDRALRSQTYRNFVIVGLTFGVVLLVRSTAALYLGVLFFYLWAREGALVGFGKPFARMAVLSFATALVLAPWIVRNYHLTGQFVPTMTMAGLAAFQGQYAVKQFGSGKDHYVLMDEAVDLQNKVGEDMGLKFRPGLFPQFYDPLDELRYSKTLGERVRDEYVKSPKLLAEALVYNGLAFWFQGRTARSTMLNVTLTLPLLALAAIGAVLGYRRRWLVMPLVLFVVAFMAPHLVTLAVARYHVTLLPILALLASIAIVGAYRAWINRTLVPQLPNERAV